jgi:hypothetical protein
MHPFYMPQIKLHVEIEIWINKRLIVLLLRCSDFMVNVNS